MESSYKFKVWKNQTILCKIDSSIVFCDYLEEAQMILEAIFKFLYSKSHGLLINPTENETKRPCASSKTFLKDCIKNKSSYY